jgi:hypothetical protein
MKTKLKDPVHLSGGNPAQEVVEGDGWEMNEERVLDGFIYRRIEKDDHEDSVDQAIFCGKAA